MNKCKCCGQIIPPKAEDKRQVALALEDTRWEKEYDDGYRTGLVWDANWMPGGPHEFPGQKGKCQSYLDGFSAGLEIRLSTNKRFNKWWYANRSRRGNDLRRYEEPVPR